MIKGSKSLGPTIFQDQLFREFGFLSFEIVSDFEFRASDLSNIHFMIRESLVSAKK